MDDADIRVEFAYETGAAGQAWRIVRRGAGDFAVDFAPTPAGHQPELRFEVRFCSRDERERDVTLEVDWGDAAVAAYSDTLFMKGARDTDWRAVAGQRTGSRTTMRLTVARGETLLGICPVYSYRQCLDHVAALERQADARVRIASAGVSEEGRSIPLIEISRGEDRPEVLVVGRCHAYETAGDYCIEGMIRFLLSGDHIAAYFLDRYRFYFIPMMNVDGVVHGQARFTASGGADLNRDFDCNRNRRNGAEKDKALVAHFAAIDRLKPAVYCNLHNWTNKFKDGLIGWDQDEVDTLASFMPAQIQDYKQWRQSVTIVPGNRSPGRYSRETYGTGGFVLEFPWSGRTVARMREIGETALKALIHTDMALRSRRGAAAS
jgi:hypothetical protein